MGDTLPAWMEELKATFGKANPALSSGDVEEGIEYLQNRGHDYEEARRVAEYLAQEADKGNDVHPIERKDASDGQSEASEGRPSPWNPFN